MRRTVPAPALLAALHALLLGAPLAQGADTGVTLLDPKGYVVLRKQGDVLKMRWQVNTTILKALGIPCWASPHVKLRGKSVELDVPFRTPAVPADGIIQVDVRYGDFARAASEQDLSLEGALDVDWSLDVRQKTPANTLVLSGQGRFSANFESYASLTVSYSSGGGFGNSVDWPYELVFKNYGLRRSNATTLSFRVKRLNEDQEIVRKHCPVRLADADYPLPPTLANPVKVALRTQTPTPAPMARPPSAAALPAALKGAAAAAPTPTPPVVQEVVNCRYLLVSTLPRADNPTAIGMTPQGLISETPLEITVRLK